jgi:hypothetical protein
MSIAPIDLTSSKICPTGILPIVIVDININFNVPLVLMKQGSYEAYAPMGLFHPLNSLVVSRNMSLILLSKI